MNDRKPCPFCGSRRLDYEPLAVHNATRETVMAYVNCLDCGADGPDGIGRLSEETEAAAWDLWNRRADNV